MGYNSLYVCFGVVVDDPKKAFHLVKKFLSPENGEKLEQELDELISYGEIISELSIEKYLPHLTISQLPHSYSEESTSYFVGIWGDQLVKDECKGIEFKMGDHSWEQIQKIVGEQGKKLQEKLSFQLEDAKIYLLSDDCHCCG